MWSDGRPISRYHLRAVERRQSELIDPRAGEHVRYLAPHEQRLALFRKRRQRFAMVGGGKAQRLHGLAKQQVLPSRDGTHAGAAA